MALHLYSTQIIYKSKHVREKYFFRIKPPTKSRQGNPNYCLKIGVAIAINETIVRQNPSGESIPVILSESLNLDLNSVLPEGDFNLSSFFDM
jgi:hypothetical protein